LKIGFGMALTGPLAGNGKGALIAIEMWANDINKKGGLLGRPVQLVYYDDQSNPALVPGIYSKLLDIDQVDLVAAEAQKRLQPGEVSTPFRSQVGYHLFRLDSRETLSGDGLVQVRNQVRDILYRQKYDARLKDWLIEIKQRAIIDVRM